MFAEFGYAHKQTVLTMTCLITLTIPTDHIERKRGQMRL